MKAPHVKTLAPAPIPIQQFFVKGHHYENMKGTYEVLSVDGATMRIRWESGEESETDVELQERILNRLEREVLSTRVLPRSRLDDENQGPSVPPSRGLSAADFSEDLSKTAWRNRAGGIGGLVTQELKVPDLCFGFWVPFRAPMILWVDSGQKTKNAAEVQAGFLCRLDEESFSYGFFVRRGDGADEGGPWHRLLAWLRAPENENWLRTTAQGNGLRVLDGRIPPSSSGYLEPSGDGWSWVADDGREAFPSLAGFLDLHLSEPETLLAFVSVVTREAALKRGQRIGRDIAQLFEALLPAYRSCLALSREPVQRRPSRARPAR